MTDVTDSPSGETPMMSKICEYGRKIGIQTLRKCPFQKYICGLGFLGWGFGFCGSGSWVFEMAIFEVSRNRKIVMLTAEIITSVVF